MLRHCVNSIWLYDLSATILNIYNQEFTTVKETTIAHKITYLTDKNLLKNERSNNKDS